MTVSLREANPADREFAYFVRRAAFREYVEQAQPWDEAEERRRHEERFGRLRYRIVVCGGRDVGVMVLATSPGGLVLHQLFLLPESQSQGIGEACMRLVLQEADAQAMLIRLRVMKVNPRAKAFYQRLGFQTDGTEDSHYVMCRKPESGASAPPRLPCPETPPRR